VKTPISYFVVLSAVLFAIGSVGVLVRDRDGNRLRG